MTEDEAERNHQDYEEEDVESYADLIESVKVDRYQQDEADSDQS